MKTRPAQQGKTPKKARKKHPESTVKIPGICGVPHLNGGICRSPAESGGKCRVHYSPPNLKHGFYSKTLTEDERVKFDTILVGEVDIELRLLRVQLQRVLRHQLVSDDKLQTTQKVSSGSPDKVESVVLTEQATDYPKIISRFISLIGKLEMVRAKHIKSVVNDDTVDGFRGRLAEMETSIVGLV